jgi:hypothetical protein
MKLWITFLVGVVSSSTVMAVRQTETANARALLSAYYSYGVLNEARTGAQSLAKSRGGAIAAQVDDVTATWIDVRMQSLRQGLSRRFGAEAKDTFASFVGKYTEAEAQCNAEYLWTLNGQLQIAPPPTSYADLRTHASDRWLTREIKDVADFMGNVQTWIDLADSGRDVPTLQQWLDRDALPLASPAALPSAPKANPLAAAEAPLPVYKANPKKAPSTMLDDYGGLRADRRRRALDEAQAGMKQVADERRTAEEEYAARKAAEAQREAEAIKAHAQKLAEVEKEAIDQSQHTWGARLKKIAVAVLSGGVSAVSSGVGSTAGAAAAEAIFD